MDTKKDKFEKRPLLPGYAAGLYEQRPPIRLDELAFFSGSVKKSASLDNDSRRKNHINIRLSDADLHELHRLALGEGVPIKSFIASIVHQYVRGELTENHEFFMKRFGREPVITGPEWKKTNR